MMLNNAFVLEEAGAFAQRVAAKAGSEHPALIAAAFEIALGRLPSPLEVELGEKLLAEQAEFHRSEGVSAPDADRKALSHLCHMLLNTSEFLYAA